MALTLRGAKILAVLIGMTAMVGMMTVTADAQTQTSRKRVSAQTRGGPNYSYQAGPRTRVYVSRRSWLDAGTEVLPGERKFNDYAYAPGYNYGRNIDRLNMGRQPLSEPFDLGGGPTRFPLY